MEKSSAANVNSEKAQIRMLTAEPTIIDLKKFSWKHLKSEGLTLLPPDKLLISNDNDFGVGEEDFTNNELLLLKFKNKF